MATTIDPVCGMIVEIGSAADQAGFGDRPTSFAANTAENDFVHHLRSSLPKRP
jgi:hypothetical protein